MSRRGEYEFRGKIVGRAMTYLGMHYDVQPNRAESLAKRVCGIPEDRLRPVGKPVLAYEKSEAKPQHIMDEA